MVFAEALTEYLITGLSERIAETESHPFPDTLHADRYLAMSALQKAIRRGNEPVALRAALNLLRGNARGFWRRLGVIAFEDIGVANIDLIGWVTVARPEQRSEIARKAAAKRWGASNRSPTKKLCLPSRNSKHIPTPYRASMGCGYDGFLSKKRRLSPC